MQERYERLAALAREDRPKAWAPHTDASEATEIVGVFVRMEYGETEYGRHGIVVLRLMDGTMRSVWLLHNVLANEFARQRPHTGDLVAIRYLGEVSGEKRKYTGYRVEVERNTPQVIDWDAVAPGNTTVDKTPVVDSNDDDAPF